MNVQIISGNSTHNYCHNYINPVRIKNNESINFNGLGFLAKPKPIADDAFISNTPLAQRVYNSTVKKIIDKIQTQSYSFTPQKLEEAIVEVKKAHPDTSEKAILLCMQRLTQWANYSSFESIAKFLTKENISDVSVRDNGDLLNKCFSYFIECKGIIGTEKYCKYKSSFITKNNLKKYKEQNPFTKLINLEGFDDGVNFLTDDNLLAQKTIDLISKTKNLMKRNPRIFYDEAISKVLNDSIFKYADDKNLKIVTFSRHSTISRETILEQMSPRMPKTQEEINLIISSIVEQFHSGSPEKTLKHKNMLAEYFEDNMEFFSKQRLIEGLKDIKNKVTEFAQQHDISEENIYYLIPRDAQCTNVKSFGVLTEMYKQLFEIPEQKIINQNNFMFLPQIPKKSAVVILDDVAISGESLKYSCGYESIGKTLPNNTHIIFAPLISYEDGLKTVNKVIKANKRANNDEIFTSTLINKKEQFNIKNILTKLYFSKNSLGKRIYGYRKGEPYFNEKFVILPYMAPDYNSKLSGFLSRYFIPCHNSKRFLAVKNTHFYFEEVNQKVMEKGRECK